MYPCRVQYYYSITKYWRIPTQVAYVAADSGNGVAGNYTQEKKEANRKSKQNY